MQPILHSFAYSLDYLREQIADVPDELLTAQPEGIANHPAWTIGHIVFISQEIGSVVGVEPWLGEEWVKQFAPGSKPNDAVSQAETRPLGSVSNATVDQLASQRARLLTALDTAQTKLTAAVAALTDEQLDAPFPDPSYSDVFPTVRHALTQVLLGHTAFHVGQISVWRRAMNLPPMPRSYE